MKWAAYGLALILLAVVNYYVLGPLPMALPLLLPMAAVAVGTLEGAGFGAGFGIAALSAIGWIAGLVTQYLLRRDVWGHLLCCIATALVWELWAVISRLLSRTAPLIVLGRVALPELGWTLALALPVYWIFRFCCIHYGRIYHE